MSTLRLNKGVRLAVLIRGRVRAHSMSHADGWLVSVNEGEFPNVFWFIGRRRFVWRVAVRVWPGRAMAWGMEGWRPIVEWFRVAR